jgi:hypothetical protein
LESILEAVILSDLDENDKEGKSHSFTSDRPVGLYCSWGASMEVDSLGSGGSNGRIALKGDDKVTGASEAPSLVA